MTGKLRFLATTAFGAFLCLQTAFAQEAQISSNVIEHFKIGSDATQFGKTEFLGGIEMVASDGTLGGWSAIRLRPDQQHFLGVLDTGSWVSGSLQRGADGRLQTLSDVDISSIMDSKGEPGGKKWRVDSESLAFRNGQILVGFERNFRIDVYPDPGYETSRPIGNVPLLIKKRDMRENRSIETLAVAPVDGPLAGAPVTIMENSLNREGNHFAAVLDGPRKGIFFVKKDEPYSVTDGVFLPDGDLLILERRFGIATGIGMQLRLIHTADIKPGATVDGEVILEADGNYQIDNMEGIDAFLAEDGTTHIIMISDDNFSLLQRNLMLEFRLLQ